jgi:hypothetical protein
MPSSVTLILRQRKVMVVIASGGSTVVKCSTPNPKSEGSLTSIVHEM